jgi:HSP20 family protein
MNLIAKRNGELPSLVTDFFSPASVLGRDVDADLLVARVGVNLPSANIIETSKEYKLTLAAPGLSRKDFDLELENHVLTISAHKEEEMVGEDDVYARKEYSFNSFCRTFTLPDNVKENGIDARYENGILTVIIPKLSETSAQPMHKIGVF